MAYYDIMNDEIRFKAGTVSSTGSTNNSPDFGNFKKQIDDINDYGHQIHIEEYLYNKSKILTK